MDNLMLNQQQNLTVSSCGEAFTAIFFVMHILLLVFGFPTTIAVILLLLNRTYKAKSFSPAEVILLQINFTNVCLSIYELLNFLNMLDIIPYSTALYMPFHLPSVTARSIFLLTLCGIFYLAIVHPVTYMTAKPLRHWEWLVTTLGWLYASAMSGAVIFNKINIHQPTIIALFYISILPIMFFNVATLKALSCNGPGNSGTTLNPAKKKAFRIILSILMVLLLYYVPQLCIDIYPFIAPDDVESFLCLIGFSLTTLSMLSEFSMPEIFLYSLVKLDI